MKPGGIDFNTAARHQPAPVVDGGVRLETLRRTLQQRADSLVRELFPAARIHGGQARIGDVSGAAGDSMSIELAGDRAGLWTDHATGDGGDLIDLWQASQGYGATGFMDAVGELELHLGLVSGARWDGPVARIAEARAKLPKVDEPTEVSRTTYVYTSLDGSAVLAQVIRIELSDGDKTYRQRNERGEWKSPEVRPLYNLPDLACPGVVVFVEGEKCADALKAEFGIACTTAMGGTNTLVEKTDWTPLRGRDVVLWPDNDLVGIAYMAKVETILRGLGCRVSMVVIPPGVAPKWDAFDCLAEGHVEGASGLIGDAVGRFGGQLTVAPIPANDRSLKLLSIGDLRGAKPPEWLIHGMVPAASFSEVIGPPGSLKSFLVIAWGLCIANGRPWLGREVKQGPVIYVAGEGQAGAAPRILGWTESLGGREDAPFFVLPQAVAMPTDQLDELIALAAGLAEKPKLIILDTLARTFGPGDENSAVDMNAFVAACDRLRQATGACVLVVHHTGKDVSKGGRGSSALFGAVDCCVALERDGLSLKVLNRAPYGKQKDAAEFDDIALTYSEYRLMMGEDEVSTLILIPDDDLVLPASHEPGKGARVGNLEGALLAYMARFPENELGSTALLAAMAQGSTKSGVAKALGRMVIAGKITRTTPDDEPGKWMIAGV